MNNSCTTIIFFNRYHIGDVHLSQPYIKNIIESNKDIYNFYAYTHINTFIFENIKIIDSNNNSHLLDIVKHHEMSSSRYIYIKEQGILLINTWLAVLAQCNSDIIRDIECNLYKYNNVYKQILNDILNEHNIIIHFNDTNIFPVIPCIDMTEFNNFQNKNQNYNFLFYYNYLPNSGQKIPIETATEHDTVILEIAKNKTYMILVPSISSNMQEIIDKNLITNIIDCTKVFNLIQDITCYNVYYLAYIANKCNISIHFDVGVCFTYINKDFIQNFVSSTNMNQKCVHLGITPYFYKNLIIDNPSIPDNYVIFYESHTYHDVIDNITKIM